MKRRALAAILVLAMALCMLPTAALAQTNELGAQGGANAEQSKLSLADQLLYIQGQANAPVMQTYSFTAASNGTTPTFYISKASQLAELAGYLNGGDPQFNDEHYKLVNDIDLSGYANWTPIGKDGNPFMGVFDGQNHTITGLKIDGSADYQGLFGYVNGADGNNKAQVKNVTVQNASVKGAGNVGVVVGCYGTFTEPLTNCAMMGGSVNGTTFCVGGVVGYAFTEVTNCCATGSVRSTGASSGNIGGVVGYAANNVTNCYATGGVSGIGTDVGGVVGYARGNVAKCYATGDVDGANSHVGGVVGYADGNVTNCYATGDVDSTNAHVGGVVGTADGSVSFCYATGNVGSAATPDLVGGVAGATSDSASIKNCAALGRALRAAGNLVNRVSGKLSDNVSDCYAWDGMTVQEGGKDAGTISSTDAASVHGADLTYNGASLSPQFSDIFGSNPAWDYTGALPTLANVGGTQSSTLPRWITNTADADKTFYIDSAADLKKLADEVNGTVSDSSGFKPADNKSGKTYILTCDISLSAYQTGTGWTPIGDSTHPFAGVFDGDGHTIEGLKIDNATANNQGLFGWVNGTATTLAQVKNVIVKNSSVKGKNRVGAVVGCYGSDSPNYVNELTGCAMVGGSVTGTGFEVGGVVGEANADVTGCYSTGNVDGTMHVGGVVGRANADVTGCYATGNVTGTGGDVGGVGGTGGVVGEANVDVTGCYSTGSVTGTKNVGGVVGRVKGGVTGCYATGNVSATGGFVGGVVGYANASAKNCVALGREVSGKSDVNRIAGYGAVSDSYAWDGMKVNGSKVTDPSVKGATLKNGADMQYSATLDPGNKLQPQFSAVFGIANPAWTFAADKLPTLKNVGGTQSNALPGWMMETAATNTTYIYTAADLKKLADEVNNGTTAEARGSGKTYKLANDIDLSAYAPGTPLGGTTGWTPIGTVSKPFAGVFDGDGHTIEGLRINNSGVDFQGLFGRTQGEDDAHKAQVKNVTVKNANIVGNYYVGAVVGYYGGNSEPLTGCAAVGGSVSGSGGSIGGVVGQAYQDVTNCYATSSVNGTGASSSNVGGVVGCASSGDVTSCYATGNVMSTGIWVGGVVGDVQSSGNVIDSYATGNITGAGFVGGVVGRVSKGSVTNCYATGNVSSTGDDVGGVVGFTAGSVTSCVALNPSVSGASKVGRVVGEVVGDGFVFDAYAWKNMTVKVGGGNADTVTSGTGSTTIHGADISSSYGLLYTAAGPLGWPGFVATGESAVWELRNTTPNKLPKLIGTTDDPTMNLAMGNVDGTNYTLTLDKQGGTGGPPDVNATLGEAMYSPIAKPTRTNYVFTGYFDAITGGTQYYNANGTSARVWDKATKTTLYAQWTANAAPTPPSGGGGYTAPGVTVYNDQSAANATVWLTGSALPANDLLITERLTSGGDYNAMLRLADKEDIFKVYNIYLRSGKKATGSAMYLHFDLANKYAGQAFTLVHKLPASTYEYFYATADANGDLSFGPLHSLSPFMLVRGTLSQPAVYAMDIPKTGDNAAPWLWAGMLITACAGLAASAISAKRRRGA